MNTAREDVMTTRSSNDANAENRRLTAENGELRLRLEEAERAFEAIRAGLAESLMHESEARFRSVRENSLDAAYRRDLQNHRFDYLSPTIQTVNGFTVEEMFAMSADEAHVRTHPDDLPGLLAAVKVAERTGDLRVEYRFKAKDGQYRWLADRAVMIKDGNGRLRYRSGVIRDITAGMRTEGALRESEQRFRLALKNAPVSVAAQDRDLRFLWAFNHRTVDSADVIGKTDADLFPPDDAARLMALKRRAMESGTEVREQLWVTSNGQRVFLDLCLEPMRDAAGRVVGVGVATVDLTERQKAEEALREANLQLAEADRRKNEFLGLLSHELRNPLTPIRNSIYILEKTVPGGPQARRALAVINRQVGHLTQLVDDLLDVTRISRGKIRLERARLDLVEVVRRSVEDHRAFLEHHELVLELPNDPISVDGDPTRLGQVIGNLLINAAKFTPETGKISVTLTPTPDSAMLEVADTGLGIDAHTLKRLFQPFAQAERSLSQSRGGVGLGLALVKGLVELHGGAVSAHSDGPGQGARFTVRLPLDDKADDARSGQNANGVPAGKRKVLIIEDNADAATHLRESLEHWDHAVEVACSGPEGLEKARQFDPDFVLCALGLQGMDGYDVARAFRADEQLKDVHLVATSNGVPPDMERAAAAGFERHLSKTSSVEKLDEVLRGIEPSPSTNGKSP
jgi:PAS domain S-box-containing protein